MRRLLEESDLSIRITRQRLFLVICEVIKGTVIDLREIVAVNAGDDLRATISQIELFKVQHESGHVVLLADPGQRSGAQAVFRAGANGYLFMGPTTEQFIKALELVMLGETILPSVLLPLILDRELVRPVMLKGDPGTQLLQELQSWKNALFTFTRCPFASYAIW